MSIQYHRKLLQWERWFCLTKGLMHHPRPSDMVCAVIRDMVAMVLDDVLVAMALHNVC